jgi:hypothetical protein
VWGLVNFVAGVHVSVAGTISAVLN